jgi:long-chain fatty acid transport protein
LKRNHAIGRTEIIADYTWTRWSRLDALRLNFGNDGAADSVIPFQWNNTSKFGMGVNHQLSDSWTARAGLEWESSAVKDALRNPIVPDSDRRFVGVGARYQISSDQSLDLALGTIRFERSGIDRSVLGAGRLRGDYALDSYHVAVQYNWR